MSAPKEHEINRAWGPRRAQAGATVQAGGRRYIVRYVLWVDTTSDPKRARLALKPVEGDPVGASVELCTCAGCSTGGGCREHTGEPCWHEKMSMAGVGPQGDDYSRRELRRRAKGWHS